MRSLGDEIAVLDGLNGMELNDKVVQMTALEMQQLLASIGANISTDGVWGQGSVKALLDLAFKKEGTRESPAKIATVIKSYAKGKMLLVSRAFLAKLAAEAGKGLEGMNIPNEYNMMNVLDASAGANYSGGSSFAPGLPLLPSTVGLAGDMPIPPEYAMQNVLDASAGANYSGGSSYAPGLPLLPSNAGLADADLAQRYSIAAGVLPPRKNVIDASGGANYSGGSSYAPGLPLLPSNAGLASDYCGCPLGDIDKYWGSTMGVDNTHYAREGVLDASAGANYSGGSSYSPGLPLLPSNAGLAGLDAVSDTAFKKLLSGQPAMQQAFQRSASKGPLMATKAKLARLQRIGKGPLSTEGRWKLAQALKACQAELQKQRAMRANIASGFRRLAA